MTKLLRRTENAWQLVTYFPHQHPSPCSFIEDKWDLLIMSDFIAHHDAWHSLISDAAAAARGNAFFESLVPSYFFSATRISQTRLPTRWRLFSLVLAFIGAHLALLTSWVFYILLNFDHLPIIIAMESTSFISSCRSHLKLQESIQGIFQQWNGRKILSSTFSTFVLWLWTHSARWSQMPLSIAFLQVAFWIIFRHSPMRANHL